MRLPAFLLMLLTAGLSLASIPYVPIKADFHNQEPQFEIIGRTLNTPVVRAEFYQGTNFFNPTGLSAYLSFGKDAYSTQMVVITGVVHASTSEKTGYAEFHVSSNQFAYPINKWYAAVMLTDTETAQVYSMAYGFLTIKPAPEVNASATFFYTRAINGDEYGPFTGSFTNWPFILKGEFLGGYVDIPTFTASNAVLQAQIDVNKTGKVDLVTYVSFIAAQADTNAGFEARIAGEEVKSIAQANTNAGFETRIVANDTGKVSLVTYNLHIAAQADTNAGFEARIAAEEGKSTAQANTNAGFEARIGIEEGKSAAQANTNIGFESRIAVEEGKSAAQVNTNAGFESRIAAEEVKSIAQANTNAGFESRIGAEEAKSTAQANTNASFETRIQEGEEAFSWGDHANEGYLTAGTNLFDEMTIAKRSMLGANLSGLTQGVYTGDVHSVSFTGVTELVYGRTYAWGFTKQNAFGTSTLSIATYSLRATAAGAASNYFTYISDDTNLVLKMDGDGSSKSDVSGVYVKQITDGNVNVAGCLRVGSYLVINGTIFDFADFYPSSNPNNFVDADITNDLSGRVDVLETGKVGYADSTYTDTVAKAASALQTETDPVWLSEKAGYATTTTVGAIDVRLTAVETGKAALVHSHVVGDVTGLQDALDSKVSTNDTRQLDFTGADVRIADATATNNPVTKSQLDAHSGSTNASDIHVEFTPTNYTPVSADVEGHLLGVDAVIGTAPVAHTQDWSTITGTPTTISGYGITDAASTTSVHAVETSLSDHVADTSNPHGVTPAQIGAAPAAHTQAWNTISGTPSTLAGYGITDGVPPTAWSAYPAQQIVDFASKGASNLARINAPNYSNLVWGYEVDAPRGAPGNGYGVIIGHATKGGDGSTVVGGLAQDYTGDCSLFGFSSSGRGVSTVAGMNGEATNRSTAVGFYAKAYNYSVALGEYSLADSNSVAIGHGITNLVPLSTRIKGKLLMAGSNIEDVGTAIVSNLQIKADSPTNGAIWIATNTAGQGAWNVLPKIYATSGDKTCVFTNASYSPMRFTNVINQVGDGSFDGVTWRPGRVGWGQISVFCNAAAHVSTGLFQIVSSGTGIGGLEYYFCYIPITSPRLSYSRLVYFATTNSDVYLRLFHGHGHNLTNSLDMTFYGAMLP